MRLSVTLTKQRTLESEVTYDGSSYQIDMHVERAAEGQTVCLYISKLLHTVGAYDTPPRNLQREELRTRTNTFSLNLNIISQRLEDYLFCKLVLQLLSIERSVKNSKK